LPAGGETQGHRGAAAGAGGDARGPHPATAGGADLADGARPARPESATGARAVARRAVHIDTPPARCELTPAGASIWMLRAGSALGRAVVAGSRLGSASTRRPRSAHSSWRGTSSPRPRAGGSTAPRRPLTANSPRAMMRTLASPGVGHDGGRRLMDDTTTRR